MPDLQVGSGNMGSRPPISCGRHSSAVAV